MMCELPAFGPATSFRPAGVSGCWSECCRSWRSNRWDLKCPCCVDLEHGLEGEGVAETSDEP